MLIEKKFICLNCGLEVFLVKDQGVYRCSRCGVMSGHRIKRSTFIDGKLIS